MKAPRAATRCWACRHAFAEHAADGACPDKPDSVFRRHVQQPTRASLSLSTDEVSALLGVVRGHVNRPGFALRTPPAALVSGLRKLMHAQHTIEARKGQKVNGRWPAETTETRQ